MALKTINNANFGELKELSSFIRETVVVGFSTSFSTESVISDDQIDKLVSEFEFSELCDKLSNSLDLTRKLKEKKRKYDDLE